MFKKKITRPAVPNQAQQTIDQVKHRMADHLNETLSPPEFLADQSNAPDILPDHWRSEPLPDRQGHHACERASRHQKDKYVPAKAHSRLGFNSFIQKQTK